jgi:hypothetical protein
VWLCGIHDRSRERSIFPIVEEPQCRIHGHHGIIVREVGVNGPVEREKFGIRGNSMVRLCIIPDRGTSETRDEFVDVSYPLNWAEGVTMPKE